MRYCGRRDEGIGQLKLVTAGVLPHEIACRLACLLVGWKANKSLEKVVEKREF